MVVSVGGVNDRLWRRKALGLQEPISLQHPVQNCALHLRLSELRFQALVLLPFLKMLVEGDDQYTATGEKRGVGDHRQIIGVDVQFELRLEIEAVLMQKTGVERIVAGHALDLSGIQQKATARLRDIGKADTGKTGDVLAGILAVYAVLECNRLRPDGSAVIAHDP